VVFWFLTTPDETLGFLDLFLRDQEVACRWSLLVCSTPIGAPGPHGSGLKQEPVNEFGIGLTAWLGRLGSHRWRFLSCFFP
jgi:hypothetical protein